MKNHRIRVIFTILSVVILATVMLSFMIAVNLIKEYEQENLINEISEQGIRIYSDSNETDKICEILNNENLNYEIKKNPYYSYEYEFDIKPFKSTPYKIITRYNSIKIKLLKLIKIYILL